jgi:tRNA threonylcarbamoyladenosine biosynthesis protein TsaB
MITLALEFSSSRRSVALGAVQPGGPDLLAEFTEPFENKSAPLLLVDRVLKQAGRTAHEVEQIVVGLGPGSYTGIRSAIALAQGWEMARQTRLAGINSMECLAAQAARQKWEGEFLFLVDAQRREFYLARYFLEGTTRALKEPLRLASLNEAQSFDPHQIAGPDLQKFFPQARSLYPSASGLIELARTKNSALQGTPLEPVYLRETSFVKAPPPRILPAS